MGFLFFIFFLLSLVCLMVGLIKPKVFNKVFKKDINRKNILKVFGGSLVISFFAFGLSPTVDYSNNDLENINAAKNEYVDEKVIEDKQNNLAEDLDVDNTEVEEKEDDNQGKVESVSQEIVLEKKIQIDNTPKLYTVISVVDGDTVKVDIDGETETLRLIGIDTPESVHPTKPVERFGIEASNKAKEILNGKKVSLESDPTQSNRGKYGRLLRYLILEDGTNFNKLMISEGYAYEYTYDLPYKYQAEFKQVQIDAKNNKKGLWADGTCVDVENKQTEDEQLKDSSFIESQEDDQSTENQSDGYKWYVSSYHSSKQYYCETDIAWKGLSEKYLKEYNSEAELLKDFPNHYLHEPCE